MQESWSFHAAQNKHAKSFFPLAKHIPSCFQSLERSLQIKNLAHTAPMLSSVLDNQKQAVTVA